MVFSHRMPWVKSQANESFSPSLEQRHGGELQGVLNIKTNMDKPHQAKTFNEVCVGPEGSTQRWLVKHKEQDLEGEARTVRRQVRKSRQVVGTTRVLRAPWGAVILVGLSGCRDNSTETKANDINGAG